MALWTLAIYIVWLRAHIKLPRRRPFEIPNRYKGAMILSRCIKDDFAEHEKPTVMKNKDFDIHRSNTLKGGTVRHDPSVQIANIETNWGMWSDTKRWIKGEKWWLVALAIDTLWAAFGWMALIDFMNHIPK